MRADRWMTTDPVVAKPGESLTTALHRMESHDVRHLPVVEGTRVVGVLSERDVLGPPLAGDREPGRTSVVPEFVRDMMAHPPITFAPDGGIPRACVEFVSRAIGCLPVVEDGRLVGLLSSVDAMRAYLAAIEVAEGEAARELLDPPVANVMSEDVVSVGLETSVSHAARTCHREGVRHLPVVEGSKLRAVLSERDLRRALAEGRADTPAIECATPSPLTIAPDKRLSSAMRLLVEQRIGALPVVVDDTLVGILSTSDVLGHGIEALRAVKDAG